MPSFTSVVGGFAATVGLMLIGGCGGAQSGDSGDASEQEATTSQALSGDCAQFVSEDPPYDYDYVAKNSCFTKTWYLKNCGTTTWTKKYWVRMTSGTTCASFHPDKKTAPGATVPMWAECCVGSASQYNANFKMADPSKNTFGDAFWLIVNTY